MFPSPSTSLNRVCIQQPEDELSNGNGNGIPVGIGEDTHLKRAIVDKNARIWKISFGTAKNSTILHTFFFFFLHIFTLNYTIAFCFSQTLDPSLVTIQSNHIDIVCFGPKGFSSLQGFKMRLIG